jgi:glutamine---fructose-6-phosphate transaminase (isomerizing)
MVTDLARRNISRICGKLGVEHLLVSADINKKRANIRKNILAWLKRPDLGVIPLFMAGDKHFYYYANQLQKQTGIKLVIWCSGSGLESADFKWYFCGLDTPDSSAVSYKLRLLQYYGKQFLLNPSYLNSSLLDTLFAFYSYYVMPRDVIYLFSYLPWDENEILSVLTGQYDWELASDTKQTWRIGDGTASFYNYIYFTAAGFTENDTFRSEQIRRGLLPRDQALAMVEQENRPRYETIKWYLSIIGLGDQFNRIIKTINAMPKAYSTECGPS